MIEIVGVKINDYGRVYYFNSNNLKLDIGDKVLVETDSGLNYAVIYSKRNVEMKNSVIDTLGKVKRLATDDDLKKIENNQIDAQKAMQQASKFANNLGLNMRFVNVNYTFARDQLFFLYTSDERVDFRELAKKLAQNYKTRIELRQIGVRDKAKEVGGLGPCGRVLCCNEFLNDFSSVSINMAKNQLLSLNPTKINGVCGRLLCCLNYENSVYSELKNKFPQLGSKVQLNRKIGEVVEINLFNSTYIVEFKDKTREKVVLSDSKK